MQYKAKRAGIIKANLLNQKKLKPMKSKILILAFLMTSIMPVIAQTYYPLVDTNKMWLSLETCVFGPQPNFNPYYIKVMNDTTINFDVYFKVFKSTDSFLVEWNQIGYIRESPERKIFYRSVTNSEGLLYDFNVEIDDTVNISNIFLNNMYHPLIVYSIDSVYINNNYRKRINFSNSFNNETWIEGIGSTLGLLNSSFADTSGCNYNLICLKENNSPVYIDTTYSTCEITDIVSIKKNENDYVQSAIYPNPITENSAFYLKNSKISTIEIFNLYGINYRIITGIGNVIKICKKEFKPGIYFYKIKSNNKIISTGSFISL